jgi:hypothetical protein
VYANVVGINGSPGGKRYRKYALSVKALIGILLKKNRNNNLSYCSSIIPKIIWFMFCGMNNDMLYGGKYMIYHKINRKGYVSSTWQG